MAKDVIKVPLHILVHPEDKNLIALCFHKESKCRVFAWITEKGNRVVVSEKDSEETIKQVVKNYFETILFEKGEFAAEEEFKKIIDEIERGV